MKMRAPSVAVAMTLLALPLLARDPVRVAPKDAPASADVAPPGESGERLKVSGVVYAADGRTPVTGASVYVYQTDARGYYRAWAFRSQIMNDSAGASQSERGVRPTRDEPRCASK